MKPRLEILDGLRGIAAIIVVLFHIFEIHAPMATLTRIPHGYLTVDFFFALSGFVLGYAYDSQWKSGLTVRNFMKRRLIRLQPMVLLGSTFGLLVFYFGMAHVETTTVGMLLFVWLLNCLLIPCVSRFDIRGRDESYPIDGPLWTLFFEYLANLGYALFIRFFPRWLLCVFVGAAAWLSIELALDIDSFGLLASRSYVQYTYVGGWAFSLTQVYIGLTRLLYPFFAGLLVYRLGLRIKLPGAFWVCVILIMAVMIMPQIGIGLYRWTNGVYEAFCVMAVFPLILMIGAGTPTPGRRTTALCQWLGRISYPLYVTHYPLIYMLVEWTWRHGDLPASVQVFNGVAVFVLSIGIAYACGRLYDVPVRTWLTRRFLKTGSQSGFDNKSGSK